LFGRIVYVLLQGSYPARLKKVLIVTAPMWFRAPFKILRLFVKEKLRDRVNFTLCKLLLVNCKLAQSLVVFSAPGIFCHWCYYCRCC